MKIIITLLLVVIFLFSFNLVRADYKRLVSGDEWHEGGWGYVKVIYDQQGHVDCYIYTHWPNSSGFGISCIQK